MANEATATSLTGSDETLHTTGLTFRGFTARETGGADSATVTIYDNNSASSGVILETFSLTAGESRSEFYETGKHAKNGVRVDYGGSGTVAGSIFHS